MIKKTPTGYMATSEAGKPMSKKNLSKDDAAKRLRQIEAYKAMDAVAKRKGKR